MNIPVEGNLPSNSVKSNQANITVILPICIEAIKIISSYENFNLFLCEMKDRKIETLLLIKKCRVADFLQDRNRVYAPID